MRRPPSVTLEDVAREAGVSRGTVSNVLRGVVPVADATRARVLTAVEQLGYRRNDVARALAENTTRTLGVVIRGSLNPYYATLTFAIERQARRDGFAVLIADTDGDPETEAFQARALAERWIDGVVFGPTSGSAISAELLDRGIPVVCIGLEEGDERLGIVDSDEEAAMDAVVEHLVELGHQRIAFEHPDDDAEAASIHRRRTALASALQQRKLALYEVDDSPTAICCHDDVAAVQLMGRLARAGTRVPEDVSVVGCDDSPLAAYPGISLTTVHLGITQLGEAAIEMLLEAVRERSFAARKLVVPAGLVIRNTTGKAATRRARASRAS